MSETAQDFVESEADESGAESSSSDSSSEADGEDDDLGDFIKDDDENGGDEGDDDGASSKADSEDVQQRKRPLTQLNDDDLDDDDYALIEENIGVKMKKKKFTRVLLDDDDSDGPGEEIPQDRRAVEKELFDEDAMDESELLDEEPVVQTRPTTIDDDDDEDEEEIDDFIVDDFDRPIGKKSTQKKKAKITDSALAEAQDIFGVEFDFDDLEEPLSAEELDEEFDEDELEEDTEAVRRPTRKKKQRKSLLFEPSDLEKGHYTEEDNSIRMNDMPERFQLRSTQLPQLDVGEDFKEANWIYKRCFAPGVFISIQDNAHPNEPEQLGGAATKPIGPTVQKIKEALKFMRSQQLEVPFMAFYRKEYVEPELNIYDLWQVSKWDETWTQLKFRKKALMDLFEKLELDEAEKVRIELAETGREVEDLHQWLQLHYGNKLQSLPTDVVALKRPPRRHMYDVCVKNDITNLANLCGLTPVQLGENLADNYQRHEPVQCDRLPLDVANDYVCSAFRTREAALEAAVYLAAAQIAAEPAVRGAVRQNFFERAQITVNSTKRGMTEIDELHPCYPMQYLRQKPVSTLRGTQWLTLCDAESSGLIKINVSVPPSLLEDVQQLYYRDEFSAVVQAWNDLRGRVVGRALNSTLYPALIKELKVRLTDEADGTVIRACARTMYQALSVAPYSRASAAVYDENDDSSNKCRVLGVAGGDGCVWLASVGVHGELSAWKRVVRKDDVSLRSFISEQKPHVVAVAAESLQAIGVVREIENALWALEEEDSVPHVPVELVDDNFALVAAGSKVGEAIRAPQLKVAASVARRLHDPLTELAQFWPEDIFCVRLHPLQNLVSKDKLAEAIQIEFINRVNSVGVDVNYAIDHPNTAPLLQFVCGLGPRKASHMLRSLRQSGARLESRTQLVTTSLRMGPRVFVNCAGFIKIDHSVLQASSTDVYLEMLDCTRVHPETYEWARKMAVDALEYDESTGEVSAATALEEILEAPDKLKDLDLDAFAEELARQGYGNKSITLYDIRAELTHKYKDMRTAYQAPTLVERFNLLTKETPDTLYIGRMVLVQVIQIAHRKPNADQLDQANPTRDDATGLWRCPFCSRSDFAELRLVWAHFDEKLCPGQAMGVRVRLDNGLSGFIHIRNLSDSRVNKIEERVYPGMSFHARITKVDIERFTVECSSRSSDLEDRSGDYTPMKDLFYDQELADKEMKLLEEERRKKSRASQYTKRVIVHPSFHNVSFAETIALLENADQGEVVVRPSSKGADHLTATWKVDENIYAHVSIKEEEKENAFSLGRTLIINGEDYEDLDEIIARFIQPMASYARDIINFKYYLYAEAGNKDILTKALFKEHQINPSKIPYIFSPSKEYPGKFIIAYQPRMKPVFEYVTLTSDGYRYRGHTFQNLSTLIAWFKQHFRDSLPRHQSAPNSQVYYTPTLA